MKLEGTAKWLATGLESSGDVMSVRGSTPLPSVMNHQEKLRREWEASHEWTDRPSDDLLKEMGFGSYEQFFHRSPLWEAQTVGYHITTIKKGELGELSKVQEELDEAVDA